MATKLQIRTYAKKHGISRHEAKEHFINEAIKNSKTYDILVRLYPTTGLKEHECGTVRVKVTDHQIRKNGRANVTRDELSGALGYAIKDCDHNGEKLMNHPEYGTRFGNLLVDYLQTFQSWFATKAVSNPAILVDYYGNAPHRGINHYEFVLRNITNDGQDLFDDFEKTRKPFWLPKY